jgi:diacylglycerol O-acyltransferase / wax synthase
MRRMTALDTWFLHVEDDADHMHIGSVGIFEGPPPTSGELAGIIAAKLDALPRYRQRLTTVPFGVFRPVWVDDPHFSVDYHVRHTALPRPGGTRELHNLVGRVMGQQLDRRRPLWETWFVEGLDQGRWAMVSKVHHCMVDGIAGTDLLALVLDTDPERTVAVLPSTWAPSRPPGRTRLLVEATSELAGVPRRFAGGVRSALRPARSVRRLTTTAHGAIGVARLLSPMPPTSLTGPIGPHRRWVGARLELDDAKRIRAALGGTVNDVVLTVIASGYRRLLAERGELSYDTEVRTMVPVSRRSEAQRGEYHNLVTAVFIRLPVAVADPAARYDQVRHEMQRAKRSGEAEAVAGLISLSGIAPAFAVGVLLRTTTRLAQRRGQRYVSTVTTNVPGPQVPLYLLGRRMVDAYPFVPIGEGLRTGIAIFSYDGALTFGLTGDYDTTEDLDVLARGIEEGMEMLLTVVGQESRSG